MATHEVIRIPEGSKGGGGKQHTPVEAADSLVSLAKMRMLIALSNGPVKGNFDGKNIYLSGTPLNNPDGSENFPGVRWEFRDGSAHQDIIKGFPALEKPHTVGTELKFGSPWTQLITNINMDAVRLRMGFPYMSKQESNGDTNGTQVDYKIELSTDGAAFQTVATLSAIGKTTSLYERDHRIDLPKANTSWQLRVTRTTPDSTSQTLQNKTQIQGWTEITDSRLRYPFTSLLFIEFDAKTFPNTPSVSVKMDGVICQVPDNYDPVTRTYTGTWSGNFKLAWTNNPAWCFYALATSELFGLGRKIKPGMLNKWDLYVIGQRCDQLVPDGKGGMEPRFTYNAYLQGQEAAWTVLRDLAAVFNGKAFWGNGMMNVVSDRPQDVKQIVSRANVKGGKFNYAGGSQKHRYSTVTVGIDDPQNHYNSKPVPVVNLALERRYGLNQTMINAIGCTSDGEGQRRGHYILYTNQIDRTCSITMGLDGIQFVPGNVIALADERLSGRSMGGRIASVASNRNITFDRKVDAAVGDAVLVRTKDGVPERRTITVVSADKMSVTVGTAFSTMPKPEAVFVIDSGALHLQLFTVQSMKHVDGGDEFEIQLTAYNESKFDAIDLGARLDIPPISLLPVPGLAPPANIVISAYDKVVQGMRVKTMRVQWDKAENALLYESQWRRGSNDWVNVPQGAAMSFEVDNIYAGTYSVRVRAIGVGGVSSAWGNATPVDLSGRIGELAAPLNLRGVPLLYGIQWLWDFPPDTEDVLKTEMAYMTPPDTTERHLTDEPYPKGFYSQMGIGPATAIRARARFVDKMGNQSDWTEWVGAESNSNADDYLKGIADDFLSAEDGKALKDAMTENYEAILANAVANNATIHEQYAQVGAVRASVLQITTTVADLDHAFAEYQTVVNAQMENINKDLDANEAQVNQKLTATVDAASASAMYLLGLKVKWNNQLYTAGMSLGVVPSGNGYVTRVGFNANQFVLLTDSGGVTSPFSVVGSNTFISNALIQNGTIVMAKIERGIRSGSWDTSGGANGWYIDQLGDATFRNIWARGHIEATSGSFQDLSAYRCTLNTCTIAADCTILGTLWASQINGPLMQAKSFTFSHFNTNASSTVYWDGTAGRGDVQMTLSGRITRMRNNGQGASRVVVQTAGGSTQLTPTGTATTSNQNTTEWAFSVDVGSGAANIQLYAGALNQGAGESTQWILQLFAAPTANQFHT